MGAHFHPARLLSMLCQVLLAGAAFPVQAQDWAKNSEGYPSVEGSWYDVDTHQSIKVTQQSANFAATMTRQDSNGVVFSWHMEGRVSRTGRLTGLLQYTQGLAPSASGYSQSFTMALSPDGDELAGRSELSRGGGGVNVVWRRMSQPSPPPPPSQSMPPRAPQPPSATAPPRSTPASPPATSQTAATSSSAPGSLESLLNALGTQWKVKEYYRPEWDWSGTWTREGNSKVYAVDFRNAGANALKSTQFKVTAESYTNGELRLRHPTQGTYIIRVSPGQRTGAGRQSWCPFQGCGVEIEFATVPVKPPIAVTPPAAVGAAPSLEAVLAALGTQWKVKEYYRPEWDWSGTWTREGNSRVYAVDFRNAGANALKSTQFKVTAESYTNGELRLRHPTQGTYIIRVSPGQRTGAGRQSWCPFQGCGVDAEFGGVLTSR